MMLDDRVISGPDVIMASKIVIRQGCVPTRVVLRKLEGKFVVHDEYLRQIATPPGSSCAFEHTSFEQGDYYEFANFFTEDIASQKAENRFRERMLRL